MYFYRQKCSRGPRRREITLKRERGEVFLRARIRIAKREKRESINYKTKRFNTTIFILLVRVADIKLCTVTIILFSELLFFSLLRARWSRRASKSIVERGDDHVVHAAVAFIFAYAVVAFLAPAHAPGIFDDPVRFFVQAHRGEAFFAVADD